MVKQVRAYQQRAVTFLTDPLRPRGFIHAAAGSGKSHIAALGIKEAARVFDHVCVIVNTIEQKRQMVAEFAEVELDPTITVNVQCAAARPDISEADFVVCDEAHHLPAPLWSGIIMQSKAVVWGFSATPWSGEWERDGVLRAFFGNENFFEIPREEILDGGSIVKGIVIIHDVDTPGEFNAAIDVLTAAEVVKRSKRMPYIPRYEHERRARWQFTIQAIRANEKRNSKIKLIAEDSIDSVLILVNSIEHGEGLEGRVAGSKLVTAKLPKKERMAAIEAFKNGTLHCLIATSLADEGLDVPRAGVLILAAGGRSAGKLEQRSGRVMRTFEGKTFGVVHDFLDTGASMGESQSKARRKVYKRLNYKIT